MEVKEPKVPRSEGVKPDDNIEDELKRIFPPFKIFFPAISQIKSADFSSNGEEFKAFYDRMASGNIGSKDIKLIQEKMSIIMQTLQRLDLGEDDNGNVWSVESIEGKVHFTVKLKLNSNTYSKEYDIKIETNDIETTKAPSLKHAICGDCATENVSPAATHSFFCINGVGTFSLSGFLLLNQPYLLQMLLQDETVSACAGCLSFTPSAFCALCGVVSFAIVGCNIYSRYKPKTTIENVPDVTKGISEMFYKAKEVNIDLRPDDRNKEQFIQDVRLVVKEMLKSIRAYHQSVTNLTHTHPVEYKGV